MRSCFVLILLLHMKALSQHNIAFTTSLSRMDFFHGIEYQYQPNRFSFEIAGEHGIKAAYFIRNIHMRFRVGSVYNALKMEKFQLGPKFEFAFSLNKLNNTQNNIISAYEVNTGLEWKYGQKWFVSNAVLVGGMVERRYSNLYDKYQSHFVLSYVFQLNFGYAF